MNSSDLTQLGNFGSALERLLAGNQRFLDGLRAASKSESTKLELEVDRDTIALFVFGHRVAARFRPVNSERGLAAEYIFRASVDPGESIEVTRFYLEAFDAGEAGGVFRDPELKDRICDAANARIADYLCFDIARAVRSDMFTPSPRV